MASGGCGRRLKRCWPPEVALIRSRSAVRVARTRAGRIAGRPAAEASMRQPMPGAGTRLSVVVVTYNSAAAFPLAARRSARSSGRGDELIVVDNALADGTLAARRASSRPGARDRRNRGNAGFAAGAQRGRRARRPATCSLFLNPDATPGAGLRRGDPRRCATAAAGRRGWASSRRTAARRQHERRRRALHRPRVGRRGGRAGAGPPAGPREVAFAVRRVPGACRASAWERLGGFAERFFMYHEDVDLSLRLRLRRRAASASSRRRASTTTTRSPRAPAKWRPLERNRWATIVRCYPGRAAASLSRRRCWRPSSRCSPSPRPAGGCRRSSPRRATRCARCRGCCASGARSRRRGR